MFFSWSDWSLELGEKYPRSAHLVTARQEVHVFKMTCHWWWWLWSPDQHNFCQASSLKVTLFIFPCPHSVLGKHVIKSSPCSREEVIKLQILTSFEPLDPPIPEAKHPQPFRFTWVNTFFYCWNQFELNFYHLQMKDYQQMLHTPFCLIPIHPPHRSQHDLWTYDKFSELPLGHSLFVQLAWGTSLELSKWCSPEASTPSAPLG